MSYQTSGQPQIYNEYEIKEVGGEDRKFQTKRKSVSIDDRTAEIMNKRTKKTGILYELAEKEEGNDDVKPLIEMTKTEINRMSVPELKEMAKINNIEVSEASTGTELKSELIELLNKLKA